MLLAILTRERFPSVQYLQYRQFETSINDWLSSLVEPSFELGRFFFTDDNLLVVKSFQTDNQLGIERQANLPDAFDISDILAIEPEEFLWIELRL